MTSSFRFHLALVALLSVVRPLAADATPFAYVANRSADNVSVIDTATNTTVATIQLSPCCQAPSGVAVSAGGDRAYIVNDNSGNVSVIDTATNSVMATVTGLGAALRSVAVNGAGTRAYVTAHDSLRVNVINTTTNTLLTTIPLASAPSGVVVSPDGTRAYTANDNSVTTIDTATNSVLGTVALPSQGRGIAVSPSGGRLYVTEPNVNALAVIDTVTNTQVATIGTGNTPQNVAVHPNGTRVYVANAFAGMNVIDAATNTVIATVAMGGQGGVGVRPDGLRVYAINSNFPSSISVVDTATNSVLTTIPGGSVPQAFGQFIGPFCPAGCTDGNTCTNDGCNPVSGCVHTNNTAPCADEGNDCTDDVCDGLGSCGHPPRPALTVCDDGTFCNGADTCDGAGACANHAGDPCASGGECADACNEGAESCFEPSATPCTSDGNVCSDDVCDGAGACTHPPNTAPCDDGLFCNGADVCAAGACTHAGDPCAGGGECDDVCNELTDVCFDPAGIACASDGNPCTVDQCDGAGACGHPAGNAGAECRADAGQCDVAESCDGVSPACPADGFEADGTTCDDGAACTIHDQCLAGACAGDSMTCGDGVVQGTCGETCDDGNLLADDGCDAGCHVEPCEAVPSVGCKTAPSAQALLKVKRPSDPAKRQLQWKWGKGQVTAKSEFGDPMSTEDFHLCVYDAGTLVSTTRLPAGGLCAGKACWKETSKGFGYKNKALAPDGGEQLKLQAGLDGKAQTQFKGKGALLDLPAGGFVGPVVVQLQPKTGSACWEATFSAPFGKNDGTTFGDKSD